MSLDGRKKGGAPIVAMTINDVEIGDRYVKLYWISMVNNGYIIRGKVHDPYYNIVRDLVGPDDGYNFLRDSRSKPDQMEIKLKIKWQGEDEWSQQIKAIITNLESKGTAQNGYLEFIAVDPPSWRLSGGRSSGKIYVGKVSQVIQQVVKDYESPGHIDLKIDETEDDPNGRWAMMRMDPRNFIMSLLDWSSSVTKKKSTWAVNSESGTKNKEKLWIQEVNSLTTYPYGQYVINTTDGAHSELVRLDAMSDQFLTVTQTNVITQGLSTVTGKYIDKITDEEKVTINDGITGGKINAQFDQARGYKKPDKGKKWSTTFMAIPEHSAGDIGKKYDEYVDGRARNAYIRLLNMVMRAKLTIIGDKKFDSNQYLGAGAINVIMNDIDSDPYFLSSNWLIHGFQHVISHSEWFTHLYISRLDWDANAAKKYKG